MSVVDALRRDAAEFERQVYALTERIADLERQIVEARDKRDEAKAAHLEASVAANIVEKAGLTVERRGDSWHVQVDTPDTGA